MESRLSDSGEFPALNADRAVGKKRGKEPTVQKGESQDETSYAESASVSKITTSVPFKEDDIPRTSTSTRNTRAGKAFTSESAWEQKTCVTDRSASRVMIGATTIVGSEDVHEEAIVIQASSRKTTIGSEDVHHEEAIVIQASSRKHSTTSSSDSSVSTMSTVSPLPPFGVPPVSDEKEKEKSSSSSSSPQEKIASNPMAFDVKTEEKAPQMEKSSSFEKDQQAVLTSSPLFDTPSTGRGRIKWMDSLNLVVLSAKCEESPCTPPHKVLHEEVHNNENNISTSRECTIHPVHDEIIPSTDPNHAPPHSRGELYKKENAVYVDCLEKNHKKEEEKKNASPDDVTGEEEGGKEEKTRGEKKKIGKSSKEEEEEEKEKGEKEKSEEEARPRCVGEKDKTVPNSATHDANLGSPASASSPHPGVETDGPFFPISPSLSTSADNLAQQHTPSRQSRWKHGESADTTHFFSPPPKMENPGYVPLLPGSGSWKQVQQLRHTVMCAYYNTPTGCFKGDACYHAHSNEGLRQKPILRKTMLCKSFARGRCPKSNEQCTYAHGTGELAATNTFFKTVRCRAAVGKCKMGENCRYAHSDEDLIQIDDAVSRGVKSEGVIITQKNDSKVEVHDDDGTTDAAGTLVLKKKENEKEAVKQKITHVGGGEKEEKEGMEKTMEESEPMEESELYVQTREPTPSSSNVCASSTLTNRVIGRAVGPQDDKVFTAALGYQKENKDEKRIINLDTMIRKSLYVIDTVFENDEETCGTPLQTAPNAAVPDTTPCFPRATPATPKPEKKKKGGIRRRNHSNFQHQRFVDCYKSGVFTTNAQKKRQRGGYPPTVVEKSGTTPSQPPPPPASRLSSLASSPILYHNKESSTSTPPLMIPVPAYPPSPCSDHFKESCFASSAADPRMIPVTAYPRSPFTSSPADPQLLNGQEWVPLNGYEPKCDESHEMRDTPTRESVEAEGVIHAPPMVDTPQKSIKNQNIILNKSMTMEKDEDAQDDDMRFLSEENEDKETEYFCATPDFMEDLEPNDIYLGEGKMVMVKTTMMPSVTHEVMHTNTYMIGLSAPENNLYLMNGPGMMIMNQDPMMTQPNSYGIQQHQQQQHQQNQANFNMGCYNIPMMWNQSYHPPSPYDGVHHMGTHPQTQMISNPIPTCTPPAW